MIPVPSSYRVYLSTGVTDMRRGMPGLSLQVQEALGRDPHQLADPPLVDRNERVDGQHVALDVRRQEHPGVRPAAAKPDHRPYGP